MNKKLAPEEVIYDIKFDKDEIVEGEEVSDYNDVFSKLKTSMEIENEGYNTYIIDDFDKDKIEDIKSYINKLYIKRKAPKDICYVSGEDIKCPKSIFLLNGKGKVFKEMVEEIKKIYLEYTFDFYNNSVNKEKEEVVNFIEKQRNKYIEELISLAKEKGFYMKAMHSGFTFIPIKEGKEMTENEYDELSEDNKQDILDKIAVLKNMSKDIIEQLKKMELAQIEKIKDILKIYYQSKAREIKIKYKDEFFNDLYVIEFLDDMCSNIESNIIDNYSMNYEDDEEKISEIINKYEVNVLVDNSDNDRPLCVFEEDPNVYNLIGNIEYENHNGVYTTGVNLIKSGSLLKVNEGCIILRVNSLLSNPPAYYYLKKSLMSQKVDFNYNRGYLELLSLSGLKPEAIPIKVKVILIGDYETYDLLYKYDEDFKRLFKMRVEYDPIVDINSESISIFKNKLKTVCKENNIIELEDDAEKELIKYLSRQVENRKKIYLDKNKISTILNLANSIAIEKNEKSINRDDIIKAAYPKELIEKYIIKSYEEKKRFIFINEGIIGQINGLSVIDSGYFRVGRPVRITCSCYSGDGDIIDVQKESNLSGNIHSKSISILKGCIFNMIGGYEKIPVDFHLSFEQLYGYLEGDSASVAEIIAMLSSLSKIPIKQNIAVTGSIDQFGNVQPIGGANEKIEGFYKVCKHLDSVKDKGVIIPKSNKDDLVLDKEVEESIKSQEFAIYTVENIFDAAYILLGKDELEIMAAVEKEMKKYSKLKRNKR
ncbi:AAA family ATPase [Haloimpatiens sp. FM7330]|uniref:AAA family ATPase n=1 Tax=Haloimpatiens sp. FM7330 TaxID=3298610 RepID=UPI0036386229